MRRREFIAVLGGAAVWPLAVRAQPGERVRRIGVIMVGDENDPVQQALVSAFTQALADLGWSNVRMDVRWPGGDINLIREFAHQMVGLQPDVIVANTTPATVALQRETRTIPIVFIGLFDPVASGIVARLDRPSENITGFVAFEATLGGKWLELLSEIAPGLKRAAILFNPDLAPVSGTSCHSTRRGAIERPDVNLHLAQSAYCGNRDEVVEGVNRSRPERRRCVLYDGGADDVDGNRLEPSGRP